MNRANRLESQQFHTPSYCLARIDFWWDDSTFQRQIDSNRNNFTSPVIAYHKSISGKTIRLCKRQFATNLANRLESSKNSHPSYCLLRVDFQGNDSTLQETFPTNRVASLSASPNRPRFVATFFRTANVYLSLFDGYRLPVVRIDSQPRSQGLSSYRPLERAKRAVRWETLGTRLIDSVRIESNR